MKKIITLFLFFITYQIAVSQEFKQTIRGMVVDADTKEAIIGAAVAITDIAPQLGTMTDENGAFELRDVPVGRHHLRVNFIGYKETQLAEILVNTGRQTVLNIELTPSVKQLAEVSVVAESSDKDKSLNTMASISARRLNMDEASRYAGGMYDAARMASSFAGVVATEGDGVNDIVVRGNSPRGLLWRLEGIEIPNPNHFTDGQGGTGGAVSIISSNSLASSDFLTGAFPAEYGNAFSGVMDLNLRKGNTAKREYAIQLGVIGLEAAAEGPISQKNGSSYMINYRYSALALLAQSGLVNLGDNNRPPVFQDLSFNVHVPTKRFGTFALFGVGGKSTTGTDPVKDTMKWRLSGEGRDQELEEHAMGVVGLKHYILFPNKKTSLRNTVAASTQYDEWHAGYLQMDYNYTQTYHDRFTYPSIKTHTIVSHRINNKHIVSIGAMWQQLYYRMYLQERDGDSLHEKINQNGNTALLQSYAQWKYRISEQFELNSGVHFQYFLFNQQKTFEPRVGLKWSVGERSSLNAGFGVHSRVESIASYSSYIMVDGKPEQANKSLGFTKAYHYILGFNHSFSQNLRTKLEVYYQQLTNVPIGATQQSSLSALNFSYGIPDQKLVNAGKGYNYGIELTLEKFYTNNYYLLFTTSLFDSRYKNYDLPWRSTVFNGNYVVNVLAGRDFLFGSKRQHTFGINGKVLSRGGFRTTPIDLEATKVAGEIVYKLDELYSQHLPAFYRIDFGLQVRINRQNYSYTFALNVQNLLNKPIVLGYEYNAKYKIISEVKGMGLLPLLTYRLEF